MTGQSECLSSFIFCLSCTYPPIFLGPYLVYMSNIPYWWEQNHPLYSLCPKVKKKNWAHGICMICLHWKVQWGRGWRLDRGMQWHSHQVVPLAEVSLVVVLGGFKVGRCTAHRDAWTLLLLLQIIRCVYRRCSWVKCLNLPVFSRIMENTHENCVNDRKIVDFSC